MATRTGIHGGNKHEIGGVGKTVIGAADSDVPTFKWLTKGLKSLAGKFR